jgi:hypothetical protein
MSASTFWDASGKPISAAQFVEQLFGKLPELFRNEDELRRIYRMQQAPGAPLRMDNALRLRRLDGVR